MILFVGQVGRDMRDREAFQEIDYRADVLAGGQMGGRDRDDGAHPRICREGLSGGDVGAAGTGGAGAARGHADRDGERRRRTQGDAGRGPCHGRRCRGDPGDPRAGEEPADAGRRQRLDRCGVPRHHRLRRGQRLAGRQFVPPPGRRFGGLVELRRRFRHGRRAEPRQAHGGDRRAVRRRRAARRDDHQGLHDARFAGPAAARRPCPFRRRGGRPGVSAGLGLCASPASSCRRACRGALVRAGRAGRTGVRSCAEFLADGKPEDRKPARWTWPSRVHELRDVLGDGRDRDARRRQPHRLAAALSQLPAAGAPARLDRRRDGLCGAGGGRRIDRPSAAHGHRLRRRRRLPDERPGDRHRRPVRRAADRLRLRQRHLRHHPHASGARISRARRRHGAEEPRLRRSRGRDGRACRAGDDDRGIRAGLRARPRVRPSGASSNSSPTPTASRRAPP